jgi:hypothetical protein
MATRSLLCSFLIPAAVCGALSLGCGGGSKAGAGATGPGGGDAVVADPTPTGPTCDDAARAVVSGVRASMQLTAADEADLTRVTAEACVADGWSPETVKCLADTPPGEDNGHCVELLTDAQRNTYGERVMPVLERVFSNAPGMGAPAGSPPPDDAKSVDPCEGGE